MNEPSPPQIDDNEAEWWINALAEVDDNANLAPLIEILSDYIPARIMPHLRDLLERKIARRDGFPSYELTPDQLALYDAVHFVRADKMSIEAAAERAGVDNVEALRLALNGRHRSFAQAMKKFSGRWVWVAPEKKREAE